MMDTDDPGFRGDTSPPSAAPDPHGQAALLLVESLIHGLIARQALTTADAIGIVSVASEVTIALAADADDPAAMATSATLLDAISASLRRDVGG